MGVVVTLLESKSTSNAQALASGGGDGRSGDVYDRLTALETHFEYVRKDLDTVASGQKEIHAALTDVSKGMMNVGARMDVQASESRAQSAEFRMQLAALPTKPALWGMIVTVMTIALAIAGLTFVIADWAKATPIF